MKKNFPLGNWFPAEVVVTKFEGHTESATERTNKQPLVSYPFEITIGKGEGSGNTATKILVAGGMVNEYEVEKVEFAKNDSTELIYLKCKLGSMPDQDITSATIENQQPHNSETEAFTPAAAAALSFERMAKNLRPIIPRLKLTTKIPANATIIIAKTVNDQ